MSSGSRFVVVTGVTKGLGEALVARLTSAGHKVAGCGRSASSIEKLRKAHPGSRFDVVDVADDAAVQAWATQVISSHGIPDILVNNAAVMLAPTPLWQVSAADFDNLQRVNLSGTANVIRAFMPHMVDSGKHGVVVNFSSYWGRSASAGVAPYCCSKWGIEGLTAGLAEDCRRHAKGRIAAVALNPGIINTDMLATAFGKDGAADYPDAKQWAQAAAPFILSLSPKDNGKSVTVPGF